MWDVLSRSRTTVHTLSFPFPVFENETTLRLYSMRFPHLRSLTLGAWGLRLRAAPLGVDDFTDFVLAHNHTLEELDIEYDMNFLYALKFDVSLGLLRADSLPHLRSFRGSASTVTVMIQARMNCLKTTLRKLIVGSETRDETLEMKRMFDAMLAFRNSGGSGSAGCFSVLREIELDISVCEDTDMIHAVTCIQKCATCFGSSLEIMTLMRLHVCITAELLGKLFGRFDKLRVIRLDEGTFVGRKMRQLDYALALDNYKHKSTIIESYVRSIASHCWALEEIFVKRDYFRNERWLVMRCQNQTVLGRRAVCDVRRHVVDKY
jgi:hypothetical protein